nr:dicarboxylate/amino acid:cation symporter [Rubeoparvulum massiliense]
MNWFRSYRFPLILLAAIVIGSVVGMVMGQDADILKPLGDLFLNLMFTIVVPLVFFSIASTIGNMDNMKRFGKIMGSMLTIFIITGIISGIVMLFVVQMAPPSQGVQVELEVPADVEQLSVGEQLVQAFTQPDFLNLLSRRNMLALIVFAMLVGIATSLSGEKGRPFAQFLSSGSTVMMKVVSIIMWYAPIGLGAYFASLVGVFGPELLGSYARAMAVYYPVAILYFFIFFTLYAFIGGGATGTRLFWRNAVSPAVTSLATGSSVATIPANLLAAERTGVPKDIRETVIPIGASIHMDGSALSAILKISFLFGIFQMDFHGFGTYATAVGIALLSGVVMGGIPGGGFLGEMLIVTMYGFPPEALPILAVLGTLVDPPATMVNATGDYVSSMMVTRMVEGKEWLKAKLS